jgi:hypothetical protein
MVFFLFRTCQLRLATPATRRLAFYPSPSFLSNVFVCSSVLAYSTRFRRSVFRKCLEHVNSYRLNSPPGELLINEPRSLPLNLDQEIYYHLSGTTPESITQLLCLTSDQEWLDRLGLVLSSRVFAHRSRLLMILRNHQSAPPMPISFGNKIPAVDSLHPN